MLIVLLKIIFKIAVLDKSIVLPFDNLSSIPDLRVSALTLGSLNLLRSLGVMNNLEKLRYNTFHNMLISELSYDQPCVFNTTTNDLSYTELRAKDTKLPSLGLFVENRALVWALFSTLKYQDNVDYFFNSKIKSINLCEKKSQITFIDESLGEQCLLADYVVGADGFNSQIRRLSGISQYSSQYKQSALTAIVETEPYDLSTTWQYFYRQGPRYLTTFVKG